mgnify:CR=1 FL=1
MKIAFHFDADHRDLGGYYGLPIRRAIFGSILRSRTLDLHTKVFQGDILLSSQTMDREKTETGEIHRFNKERFLAALETLLNPGTHIWMTFTETTIRRLMQGNVFVLLFESISFKDAREIDVELRKEEWYLGALQIDDTCAVHWVAYANAMVAYYRIMGRQIHLFWDGISDDSKDEGHIAELEEIGFSTVRFEALNGKFSVFDRFHDYQHARRVAELGSALADALGTMADQVITRFSDSAPELGSKLWSAIRTFDQAEVAEDYAQVATSCRRVLEYVADTVFPPNDELIDGRKLGPPHYRNRLLAFADESRRSDTNIDLICAATALLADQLEKLSNLTNKGVHAELSRHEARRCLLRTIMALDDMLSLKRGPFEVKVPSSGI